VLIHGDELDALREVSTWFGDCFGLEARVLKYQGKRPLGLYEWDFECLLGGIEASLTKERRYGRGLTEDERAALGRLYERLAAIYKETYG